MIPAPSPSTPPPLLPPPPPPPPPITTTPRLRVRLASSTPSGRLCSAATLSTTAATPTAALTVSSATRMTTTRSSGGRGGKTMPYLMSDATALSMLLDSSSPPSSGSASPGSPRSTPRRQGTRISTRNPPHKAPSPPREGLIPCDASSTISSASTLLDDHPHHHNPTLDEHHVRQSLRPTAFEILGKSGIYWCRYCGVTSATEKAPFRPSFWGKRTLCNRHGCDYRGYGYVGKVPRLDLTAFEHEGPGDRIRPILQDYCCVCFENRVSEWIPAGPSAQSEQVESDPTAPSRSTSRTGKQTSSSSEPTHSEGTGKQPRNNIISVGHHQAEGKGGAKAKLVMLEQILPIYQCDGCSRAYHSHCYGSDLSHLMPLAKHEVCVDKDAHQSVALLQPEELWFCSPQCQSYRHNGRLVIDLPKRELPLMRDVRQGTVLARGRGSRINAEQTTPARRSVHHGRGHGTPTPSPSPSSKRLVSYPRKSSTTSSGGRVVKRARSRSIRKLSTTSSSSSNYYQDDLHHHPFSSSSSSNPSAPFIHTSYSVYPASLLCEPQHDIPVPTWSVVDYPKCSHPPAPNHTRTTRSTSVSPDRLVVGHTSVELEANQWFSDVFFESKHRIYEAMEYELRSQLFPSSSALPPASSLTSR